MDDASETAFKLHILTLKEERDRLIIEVQTLKKLNSEIQELLEEQTALLQDQERIHALNIQIEELQQTEIQALKDYISVLVRRISILTEQVKL